MEQTPQLATTHKVPDVKLLSVEFPGHVKSINKVKEALGGEQAIRNVNLSCLTTSFTKNFSTVRLILMLRVQEDNKAN